MSRFFRRVANNLARPLPDLVRYFQSKLLASLWRRSLNKAGTGFQVSHGTRIEGGDHITIGEHFHGGPLLWLQAVRRHLDFRYEGVIEIGSHVTCSEFVHITANNRVTIGDGTLIGSRVHITDHAHGNYQGESQDGPEIPPERRPLSPGRPVTIGANVWLGDGVVVLPGVTIGAGTIVGANSVVSRDLPPRVIAVGAPAIPIKIYDAPTGRWQPLPKAS